MSGVLVGTKKYFCAILFLLAPLASAQEAKITLGGFIDTQYSFDFNTPESGDRAFTTQPARHNEFNINLAFAEVRYDSEKIRSRFALQAGTSVQANYLAEPTNGTVSGDDLARHIQEARIGYKLSESTWIDAGIFFAHVGAEGWISKDNLTLTRSLVSDFSPYYLSGVKMSHAASDRLSFLLTFTNGWQNISENNQDKNVGTGIQYNFESLSVSYNTLLGREVSPPANGILRTSKFRHFHDFVIKSRGLENWEWVAQYDVGLQKEQSGSGTDLWQGALLITSYKLRESQKINARIEWYQDQKQLILVTNRPQSFEGYGGSLGFDKQLEKNVLWRLESRYIKTNERVFPKNLIEFADSNFTLTTSLSIQF